MYITNYPVFFQCYFRSGTDINDSLQLLDFFPGIISWEGTSYFKNGRFIFSGGFIFRWRGHPNGVASALMRGKREGGWQQKINGVESTPSMPLPTRANPGLCCNRIKKKHELQYAPENLQEKDLNFTRKGTSSQINF